MVKNVDEYIQNFDGEVQEKLIQLRKIIRKTIPEAIEKISWGVPTYYLDGYLLQFAGYKKYIGFYTSPKTIAYFKEDLVKYKTNSKNTTQFLLDEELPEDLIVRMILFLIKEKNVTYPKLCYNKKVYKEDL